MGEQKDEEDSDEKGVLQKKLTVLAVQIGYAGLYVAIFTVLWLSINFSLHSFQVKRG